MRQTGQGQINWILTMVRPYSFGQRKSESPTMVPGSPISLLVLPFAIQVILSEILHIQVATTSYVYDKLVLLNEATHHFHLDLIHTVTVLNCFTRWHYQVLKTS